MNTQTLKRRSIAESKIEAGLRSNSRELPTNVSQTTNFRRSQSTNIRSPRSQTNRRTQSVRDRSMSFIANETFIQEPTFENRIPESLIEREKTSEDQYQPLNPFMLAPDTQFSIPLKPKYTQPHGFRQKVKNFVFGIDHGSRIHSVRKSVKKGCAALSTAMPVCKNHIRKTCERFKKKPSEETAPINSPLNVPEILSIILEYVDSMTKIPVEAPINGSDLKIWQPSLSNNSQSHRRTAWNALIEPSAPSMREKTRLERFEHKAQSLFPHLPISFKKKRETNAMVKCMLVNRTWYNSAQHVIHKNIHFTKPRLLNKFMKKYSANVSWEHQSPRSFVLNNVRHISQSDFKELRIPNDKLEWLELNMCPYICPTRDFFIGGQLKKIVLPGCLAVEDIMVRAIALLCPLLEHLDLRECDRVSDASIRLIAFYCRKLTHLNLGRNTHSGSNENLIITSSSIRKIAKYTQISDLGLAGCWIDDSSIWALVIYRGKHIKRLCLTNCEFLTNNSLPRVLGYLPNLRVADIRGCMHIDHALTFSMFLRHSRLTKGGSGPLIMADEAFRDSMLYSKIEILNMSAQEIYQEMRRWIMSPGSTDELSHLRALLIATDDALEYPFS